MILRIVFLRYNQCYEKCSTAHLTFDTNFNWNNKRSQKLEEKHLKNARSCATCYYQPAQVKIEMISRITFLLQFTLLNQMKIMLFKSNLLQLHAIHFIIKRCHFLLQFVQLQLNIKY